MLVGVISDTHGHVDPRLAAALAGVQAILHAGDVGGAHVLEALRAIAPLHAVRGNDDDKLGGLGLPLHADVELAGVRCHLVHQLSHARPPDDAKVLVFGHSHLPLVERRGPLLIVNPGAAGRVGFHRLQTAALLDLHAGRVRGVRLVELGPREQRRRQRADVGSAR